MNTHVNNTKLMNYCYDTLLPNVNNVVKIHKVLIALFDINNMQ